MSFLKYDREPIKCRCGDCGKVFDRGTEGDNELYCLRCVRNEQLLNQDCDRVDDERYDQDHDEYY